MKPLTTAMAGLAVAALTLTLAGCGARTDTAATTDQAGAPGPATSAAAPHQYAQPVHIEDSDIADCGSRTAARHSAIEFPVPPDWRPAGDPPQWAFGAIIYDKAKDPGRPTVHVRDRLQLVGDVDQQDPELAPAQLNQFPRVQPVGEPTRDSLGGFDAINHVGTYVEGGQASCGGPAPSSFPARTRVFVAAAQRPKPRRQGGRCDRGQPTSSREDHHHPSRPTGRSPESPGGTPGGHESPALTGRCGGALIARAAGRRTSAGGLPRRRCRSSTGVPVSAGTRPPRGRT